MIPKAHLLIAIRNMHEPRTLNAGLYIHTYTEKTESPWNERALECTHTY